MDPITFLCLSRRRRNPPNKASASPDKRGFDLCSGRVIEPYRGDDRKNELAEFKNEIRFQGKCYAISLQGCLALLVGRPPPEDTALGKLYLECNNKESRYCTDDLLQYDEITALGRHRVVPHCKVSKHFREYLLEYEGEIYLVFLLSRASISVVDGVEVYRLDASRLVWEKLDRLKGDAMFFLEDDICFGISASLLGCNSKRSNCVYFTHHRAEDGYWFVYDMETSCVSPIPNSLF